MEVRTEFEGVESRQSNSEIDWDAYASTYDLLAAHNPSYQENIQFLRAWLHGLDIPEHPVVCDVGAGTGNFICSMAPDLPGARFVHLDADGVMNDIAQQKYYDFDLRVDIHCCSATEAVYPAQSFDLIVCVNALYAMHPQREVLRKMKSWLKPTGRLFLIDYGRKLNLWDWVWFLFRHVVRTQGLLAAIRLLQRNAENVKQNRRGSQGQSDGLYWLHTTEEFGQILSEIGFVVETLRPCYRGYSDLAICRLDHT